MSAPIQGMALKMPVLLNPTRDLQYRLAKSAR